MKNVSIPFDVSSDSECLLELPESRFCQWWDDSRGNVHQPSHLIRNLVVGARSDVTNHFLKWETSSSIPKVAGSWIFGNFLQIFKSAAEILNKVSILPIQPSQINHLKRRPILIVILNLYILDRFVTCLSLLSLHLRFWKINKNSARKKILRLRFCKKKDIK